MKSKVALFLTALVMTSLISFSNRCGQTCNRENKVIVAVERCAAAPDSKETAESSPLLRIAVVL